MEDSDSELDKRFSDLLAPNFSKGYSPMMLQSASNTNECDSDDPFEDILASKNITFSRSRTCLNDIYTFPSTPLQKSHSFTNTEEFGLGLLPKEKFNSERKSGESVSNNRQTSGKTRCKSVSKNRFRPPTKKSVPRMQVESSNVTSRSNFLNISTDDTLKSCQRVKSPISESSLENNVWKRSTSSGSTSKATTKSNSGYSAMNVLGKSPAAFSKHSKVPSKTLSSFQKYSLMRTALAAKKEFEDLVKKIALKKALKEKQENLVPTGDNFSNELPSSTLMRKTNYGTPVPSSTRIDSLSPTRCSSPRNSSTTFISCLDESVSLERKSGQSCLKTPFSKTAQKDSSINSMTGVKKLHTSPSQNNPAKLLNEGRDFLSENQAPDPYTLNILQGVVAYVEIRSGREYRNMGTQAELESLGAKVEKNFTKKVTHCFFHGGKMSTYRKAVDMNVPLVSTLWIEACKEDLCQVPLKGFEPYGIEKYQEELPLYKLKTKIKRPMTDSKISSKTWKKLAERDKAEKPADKPSAQPVEIKRPMTDSKISSKTWKKLAEKDKAEKPADKPSAQPVEADKLIGALHSVAGDFRKVSHQSEKILKSPILQNKLEEAETTPNTDRDKNKSTRKRKRIKKLVFTNSSDEDGKNQQENPKGKPVEEENTMDDSSFELKISYDSDDLLSYAKKQAANNRYSAPGQLLTNQRCKRLLTSCEKPPNAGKTKVDYTSNAINSDNTAKKQLSPKIKKSSKKRPISGEDLEKEINEHEAKKRKLLMNSQVISNFSQDSRENMPELLDHCPYIVTPGKKAKTGGKQKSGLVPVFSDWESYDSVTRARRESSPLFVKKEKEVAAERSVPIIVCTSLSRSEVKTVAWIATKLGKFIVEATVSEQTTHLVTPTPRRTVNLLKGIARGCWVLNIQWVYDSLEADTWLHEERYEMLEFSPSVRQARLERQAFGREFNLKLFSNVGPVYVCRDTMPPQADLIELLRLCGATVVSSARAARMVVGNRQNFSPTLDGRTPLLIREKWVLDSVTRLTSLNPMDYRTMQPES